MAYTVVFVVYVKYWSKKTEFFFASSFLLPVIKKSK